MGRTVGGERQADLPKMRWFDYPNLVASDRWIPGAIEWWCLDTSQAVGIFSSKEAHPDLSGFTFGNDYEIVHYDDGTFSFQKKEKGTPPPSPSGSPTEGRPQCSEWQHDVRKYVGFTEAYDYCAYCDAKKLDGKWVRKK